MRKVLLLVLLILGAAPTFGQDEQYYVDPVIDDAMAGPLPTELPQGEADTLSAEIFGPLERVDLAYGAFQRGYYLTALELALERAGQGDAVAQTLIGELYANGLGVVEDPARAASWYQLASDNGDVLATFALALLYQSGIGVQEDRAMAAALFTEAAEAGYMPAKYNLALLHVEGVYAQPSLVDAARLMREAAEAGLPEAQYDYGVMLLEGFGMVPDPVLAADFIRKAAESGLVEAQVDYATMLYLGQGIERDLTEAISWYRKAANAGNAVAQNRYAKLLAVGEGVELDLQEAAMWRALARRQGFNDPTLDQLLVSIPPDQLATAEERARFWPAAPPTVADAAGLVPELSPSDPVPAEAPQSP